MTVYDDDDDIFYHPNDSDEAEAASYDTRERRKAAMEAYRRRRSTPMVDRPSERIEVFSGEASAELTGGALDPQAQVTGEASAELTGGALDPQAQVTGEALVELAGAAPAEITGEAWPKPDTVHVDERGDHHCPSSRYRSLPLLNVSSRPPPLRLEAQMRAGVNPVWYRRVERPPPKVVDQCEPSSPPTPDEPEEWLLASRGRRRRR